MISDKESKNQEYYRRVVDNINNIFVDWCHWQSNNFVINGAGGSLF